MINPDLKKIVVNAAKKSGVDQYLAIAIATVESGWDPWSARFERKWLWFKDVKDFALKNCVSEDTEKVFQATSWGLMQCMGAVARELGFTGPLQKLCDPLLGAEYGCEKLAALVKKWGLHEEDVIAAYNGGSPVRVPNEGYRNQNYVDRVLKVLAEYRPVSSQT